MDIKEGYSHARWQKEVCGLTILLMLGLEVSYLHNDRLRVRTVKTVESDVFAA